MDVALIEAGGKGRFADFSPIKLPEIGPKEVKAGELRDIRITGYDAQNLLGEFA